jgi:DNA-binding response OmpR family regulator
MNRLNPPDRGTDSENKIVVEGGQGELVIDIARHEARWNDELIEFTRTEINILRALAEHPGVVKSRAQLLDEVWQDDVYVVDRSIDSHIKRIRGKIRAHDPDFSGIETIYGFGYKLNLSLPDGPRAYLRDNSVALFAEAGRKGKVAKGIKQHAA